MRLYALVIILGTAILLTGCGGGKKKTPSTVNVPAKITVNPNTVSLTAGNVASLVSTITDTNNSLVTNPPAVTYSSSDTGIVNVSPSGLVCGGTWDANYIDCTAGPTGTATITATSGSLKATVAVFVHLRVDRVVVSPSTVDCISMGTQQQLTLQAFSNGQDITSQVGPANWAASNTSVASVTSSGAATAEAPGRTTIGAQVAGVTSLPITFITCPVAHIDLHVKDSTSTSVAITKGGSAELAADAFDSKGVKITPTLSWLNSQPVVVSLAAGKLSGLVPGVSPVNVACLPRDGCNVNLNPTYSNLVVVTLAGTETPSVLSSGTSQPTIVPTDMASGTRGTATTLPYRPNSLLVDRLGQTAVMGSGTAVMIYSVASNLVSTLNQALGKVLAGSRDLKSYITFDSSKSKLYLTSSAAGGSPSTQGYDVAGATAASFSPDGTRAFVVAGSNLYFTAGNSLSTPTVMAAPGNDVVDLPSGQFVYVAGGAPSAITVWASYDGSQADTINVPATPLLINALPDGSRVIAVDNSGVDVVTPSSTFVGLPPQVSDSVLRLDPALGTFSPRQIIVSADSKHAVITTGQPRLIVVTKAPDTSSTDSVAVIPVTGGVDCTNGGASLDGATVYVGCSDKAIHVIDLATLKDVKQYPVPFSPDLNAVRAK